MRKIKFRGKSTDTGEWVYGSLIKKTDSFGVLYLIGFDYGDMLWEQKEVNPETVGQFTGLQDANGKAIYEGDIVEVQGTKRCGKYLTEIIFEKWGFKLKINKTYYHDYMNPKGIISVIGNIHDNQDLLNQNHKP